jgi:hypothetical protein
MFSIIHVMYLKASYNIIDYVQEARRVKRVKERVTAMIIVEDKDWLAKDSKKDSCLELKTREMNNLIRMTGC